MKSEEFPLINNILKFPKADPEKLLKELRDMDIQRLISNLSEEDRSKSFDLLDKINEKLKKQGRPLVGLTNYYQHKDVINNYNEKHKEANANDLFSILNAILSGLE